MYNMIAYVCYTFDFSVCLLVFEGEGTTPNIQDNFS